MKQKILLACLWMVLAWPGLAAQEAGFRGFNQFSNVVPGIDFFASNRQQVTPFEQPMAAARQRLADLLGSELPRGAVFICSTLEQKDSVYEPRVLKNGYRWLLSSLTAEARTEEMLARIKSQGGNEVSPELLQRIRSRSQDMRAGAEAAMVRTAVREMAMAVIQVMYAPEREFRISRLDDAARSPLPDWLDIGIAAHVAGGGVNIGFLQQRIEEAFPLEDLLGAGGGGSIIRMGGGPGGGAPPGGAPPGTAPPGATPSQAGGGRGGPRTIPKDQQDRMLFDAEAATFFGFLLDKVGSERIRGLIQAAREEVETRDLILSADMLASDIEKTEAEWLEWIKQQKVDEPTQFRMRANPAAPANPPQPAWSFI